MVNISPKAIAITIAAIIIASSSFFIFHVSYSTEIPNLKIPKIHPPQIFQQETQLLAGSTLGTSFSFISNATFTLEGYIYKNSGNGPVPLSNKAAYIYVFPWVDEVTTTSNGFYSVTVVHYGSYSVGYTAQNFTEVTKSFSIIQGSSDWQNVTLSSATFYKTTGSTVLSNGSFVPDVQIVFHAFFGDYTTVSASNGTFSTNLPSAMYISLTLKGGYYKFPKPLFFNVTGVTNNLILTMNKTNQIIYFNVSGYLFNKIGKPVSGGIVTDLYLGNGSSAPQVLATTTSLANGSYKIRVPEGYSVLYANGASYLYSVIPNAFSGLQSPAQIISNLPVFPKLLVDTSLYNENASLTAKDPFTLTGTGSNGTQVIPLYDRGEVTHFLNKNYSTVNYGNGVPLSTTSLLEFKILNINESYTPLSNYPVAVISNISGTPYYATFFTNSTGGLQIPVYYYGSYSIVIFIPGFHSEQYLVSNGAFLYAYLNPLRGEYFNISGYILNKVDGAPLNSAFVNNSLSGIFPVNYSQSSGLKPGQYRIFVFYDTYFPFMSTNNIPEEFVINASYQGFISASIIINFNKGQNLTNENISLVPVQVIGFNSKGAPISQWGGTTSGIPGVNAVNVSKNLSTSAAGVEITYNGYGSISPSILNITLLNEQNVINGVNPPIPGLSVQIFILVNGVIYNTTATANGTGVVHLRLLYTMYLGTQVYGINYVESGVNSIFSSISSQNNYSASMIQRTSVQVTLKLQNSFALSHKLANQNISVSESSLSVTNSTLPINPVSIYENPSIGTEFNYSLPQGNYSFSYSNPGFVSRSFYYFNDISSSQRVKTELLQGYGLVFSTSTILPYYMYVNYSINKQGIYDNNLKFSTFQNGIHLLNLSVNSPSLNYAIYFNATRQNPIPLNFWNFTASDPVEYVWYNTTSFVLRNIPTSGSLKKPNIYYNTSSFNINAIGYIYKFQFNGSFNNAAYNLSAETTIDFIQLNALYTLTSTVNNLTIDPLYYNGQNMEISIKAPANALDDAAFPLTLTLWMYETQYNAIQAKE